jgi:hypothetical protein
MERLASLASCAGLFPPLPRAQLKLICERPRRGCTFFLSVAGGVERAGLGGRRLRIDEVLIWRRDERAPRHPPLFRAGRVRRGMQALFDLALYLPPTLPDRSPGGPSRARAGCAEHPLPDLTKITWGETGDGQLAGIGMLRALNGGR